MADKTPIEWADATWTPIRASAQTASDRPGWHCEHVSEGCRNCYAETMNRRLGNGLDYKPGNRAMAALFLDENMLLAPLRWKKPRRIFVCSMTDLFADFVSDEWIDRMFAVMALCPQHAFQILSKRPERMREYVGRFDWDSILSPEAAAFTGDIEQTNVTIWPLPNVWLGVSVEDQAAADARIPHLLATPAAVRFLSCEPLLGPVDLTWLDDGVRDGSHLYFNALTGLAISGGDAITGIFGQPDPKIDWVICGGESGPGARPMHPDWARALRDQCADAGVPFFFKQWGEFGPDTGPDEDFDRQGYRRVRVMEGAGPCGVLVEGRWKMFDDGYAVPIDLCSGHGEHVYRVGKKAAGRLLDGAEHNGFPGETA